MIDFSVDIDGATVVDAKLQGLQQRVSDFSPAFELIHQSFLQMEKEQFDSEGQGQWASWTDLYDSWRQERGAPGSKIMQWSGQLMRSLTVPGAKGSIVEISSHEAKFGTDLSTADAHPSRRDPSASGKEYGLGWVHQRGYTAKYPYGNPKARSKRVPSRKLIELTDKYKTQWMKIIQAYVTGSSSVFPEHF